MVDPIYIVAVLLGISFSLGFIGKKSENIARILSLLSLSFTTLVSAQWFYNFVTSNIETYHIFTTAFKPPFSINLIMGKEEALFTMMINAIGLLGGLYMFDRLKAAGKNSFIALLMLIMGLNVVVMTRDLFNIFVFLEISSIAVAGLIVLTQNTKSISAGFKYMIATGIISGLLLLGIAFIYNYTGSLNIDHILTLNLDAAKGLSIAIFFLMIAIVLETKPFPANGWGLDVYSSAESGVSSLLSSAYATATVFVLMKLLPFAPENLQFIIAAIGIVTFVLSNLMGIRQDNPNRMLGYSSISQIGLLAAVIGLSSVIGEYTYFIVVSILISHFLAKSGLFWIAGIVKQESIKNWSILRSNKLLLVLFGVFIFALTGLPPFPGFFGKWELIMQLAETKNFIWIFAILIGSFFEVVYMFRWLGYAIKNEVSVEINLKATIHQIIPIIIFAAAAFGAGYYVSSEHPYASLINYLPLAVALGFAFIEFLPVFIKNTLAIVAMGLYYYLNYKSYGQLQNIFAAIFILGGILTLIAGFAYKGKRIGFYPFALMMYAGLIGLVEAKTTLDFFFSWEVMTIGSYFLIIRGKKSIKHAFSYLLFSIAGAYLILTAFGLAAIGKSDIYLSILSNLSDYQNLIFGLLIVGFLTKMASLGLHIWLPGAHAEAESDVSPMVSAILLKAGVFGLVTTILAMGTQFSSDNILLYIFGWLGAFTALFGNLAASFQEDAKKLLAYSSIGQLGYILFAFATATHMGWLGGFTYTLNHFAFKAVLFLTIGGIVLRLKTHNMYEMGGLIKNMPFSFIAVLIGIITLSGVPPLSGFAGKWLLYNTVVMKAWYFQGAVVFFAGIIAFLYCFRLIYSIFLGQLKDNHRNVKEISIWFLIPIYILLAGIMVFSNKPEWILVPIGNYLATYFDASTISWNGSLASCSLGYWNGNMIMIIIGVMFVMILGWLILFNRKARKVKQFNIVYAGERPYKPETTHMSHNMYAGYNKALGFLVLPYVSGFWKWISEAFETISDSLRKVYSGNGQAYLVHIVIFVVALYFIAF